VRCSCSLDLGQFNIGGFGGPKPDMATSMIKGRKMVAGLFARSGTFGKSDVAKISKLGSDA
jgi:hypothetical protein